MSDQGGNLAEQDAANVWPIVNITVSDSGVVTAAKLYAPGLPAGNHDVYPVRVPYMDEHTEAWMAVSKALEKASPGYLDGSGNGIECAVKAIHRLAAQQQAEPVADENAIDELLASVPEVAATERAFFGEGVERGAMEAALRAVARKALDAQSGPDARDAARWRAVLRFIGAWRSGGVRLTWTLESLPVPAGINLMQGSVAQHFEVAIDAMLAAAPTQQQEGGS